MRNKLFNEFSKLNSRLDSSQPLFDIDWLIKNMFGDKSKFRKEKIKSIFNDKIK